MSVNLKRVREAYNQAREEYVAACRDFNRINYGGWNVGTDVPLDHPAVIALDRAYRAYTAALAHA